MKLFYMPGACSLSPHIVSRELDLKVQLVKVDRQKKTEEGEDYLAINSKGYVPALQLDNGHVLTEGGSIVQYLADRKPEAGLIPKPDAEARYVVQGWLIFIATELHKNFSPLFNPNLNAEWKEACRANITKRLGWAGAQLADKPYLMGSSLSVADPYLFVILRWAKAKEFNLAELKLHTFFDRMSDRPAVQAALKAEGLG